MSKQLRKITGVGLAIILPLLAVFLFSSVFTGLVQISRLSDPVYAACGDGVLDGSDVCDDGNITSGDGCSEICDVEPGYACSGIPSVCLNYAPRTGVYVAVCGNGIVEGNLEGIEECDDGKQCADRITACTQDSDCTMGDLLCKPRSGDNCSDTCQIEQSSGGSSPPPIQNIFISGITVRPEGRSSNNYDTTFHFKVMNPDNQNHQVLYSHPNLLNSDNAGVNNSLIQLTALSQGNYDISLKSKAHLSLILDNVHLYPGDNFLNFTNTTSSPTNGSVVLKAGDIDGLAISSDNLGDNVINSVDVSILLSKMGNADPTGNNIRANLNQDNVVNQADLTILLGNLDQEGQI